MARNAEKCREIKVKSESNIYIGRIAPNMKNLTNKCFFTKDVFPQMGVPGTQVPPLRTGSVKRLLAPASQLSMFMFGCSLRARDANYILCKEQKRVCRHFILNFPHFTFSTRYIFIYLPGSSAKAITSNISNYDLTQPDIF